MDPPPKADDKTAYIAEQEHDTECDPNPDLLTRKGGGPETCTSLHVMTPLWENYHVPVDNTFFLPCR